MNWLEILGYLASALVLATFCMRTMIPLRAAAIASNVAFLSYGILMGLTPIMVLHAILLPLNVWRMIEMLQLLARVSAAARGDLSLDWLKPFMKTAHLGPGELLFRKGDEADRLYVVLEGSIRLEETGIRLGIGDVLGEIGLFAPDRARTQTARSETELELLWMTEKELAQICYQNPGIAFHLLRLISARLLANTRALEAKLSAVAPSQAARAEAAA